MIGNHYRTKAKSGFSQLSWCLRTLLYGCEQITMRCNTLTTCVKRSVTRNTIREECNRKRLHMICDSIIQTKVFRPYFLLDGVFRLAKQKKNQIISYHLSRLSFCSFSFFFVLFSFLFIFHLLLFFLCFLLFCSNLHTSIVFRSFSFVLLIKNIKINQ